MFIMKQLLASSALASMVLFSNVALAQNADEKPNYDFIGAGYAHESSYNDGYLLEFEKSLTDRFFISADYRSLENDGEGNVDLNNKLLFADVGYKVLQYNMLDVYAKAGVANYKSELTMPQNSFDNDDTGWHAAIGARARITSWFEVDFNIGMADVFDNTQDTMRITTRFYATDKLSVALQADSFDAFDTLGLSVRYSF